MEPERPTSLPVLSCVAMLIGGTLTFAALAFVLDPRPALAPDAEPLARAFWLMQRNLTTIFMPVLVLIGGLGFTGGALLWRGTERGRQLLIWASRAMLAWAACLVLHQLFWMPTLARFMGLPTGQMVVAAVMLVLAVVVVVVLPLMLLLRKLNEDDIVAFCRQ